jgi:prophage regulatory protein
MVNCEHAIDTAIPRCRARIRARGSHEARRHLNLSIEITTTPTRKRGRPRLTEKQRAAREQYPRHYNRKSDFVTRPDVVALAVKSLEPGRLLSRPEVIARTGISTSAIYARLKTGKFPIPIPLSRGAVRWRSEDIARWCADPLGWKADNDNASSARAA